MNVAKLGRYVRENVGGVCMNEGGLQDLFSEKYLIMRPLGDAFCMNWNLKY